MSQEVGVRNISDLMQFGNDLKMLSEQLASTFSVAERRMHQVCEGWDDRNNQQFMIEFTKSAKEIAKIAEQMSEYAKYISSSCNILEMYKLNKMK